MNYGPYSALPFSGNDATIPFPPIWDALLANVLCFMLHSQRRTDVRSEERTMVTTIQKTDVLYQLTAAENPASFRHGEDVKGEDCQQKNGCWHWRKVNIK